MIPQASLFRYRRWLRRLLLAVVVTISMGGAFFLRFDFDVPEEKLPLLAQGIGLALLVKLPIFLILGIDRGGWKYLELRDFIRHFRANVLASAALAVMTMLWVGPAFPRSVYVIDGFLCLLITAGSLLAVRLSNEPTTRALAGGKKILIYGAGTAGRMLLREILGNASIGYQVVGFIDDDLGKAGVEFDGVRVLCTGRQTARTVESLRKKGCAVEEIIVAMPAAGARAIAEALANCRAAGVRCKTIPSLGELAAGRAAAGQIRDVSCADLLGREPVQLDQERIRRFVAGNCVLVTGGGGSIGSELCRQLVRFNPSKLVIFEQAESDLYHIERELKELAPESNVVAEVGTIRSRERIAHVIERHGVHSIFHAAAYKHVPMMELHPLEAVANNVIGTYNLIEAAVRGRVASFVMISTDKAVNPTSVMGLTKRVAEILVASMPTPAEGGVTKFSSVRFGNVLGSNGSVVPLFQKQIQAGGPVTVTHPDMTRYFMTIPEAAQLVLEAAPMSEGGEIFVLDMGEPVRIKDLAENMIRLSGRSLDEIEIRFTGLRIGEKLFEEIHLQAEDMLPTHHPKIRIFASVKPDRQAIRRWVQEVEAMVFHNRDEEGLVAAMAALVPEYTPSKRWAPAVARRRIMLAATANQAS